MLKLVSFHIQAHLNAFHQILEYFSQSVEVDGLNLMPYTVFELIDCAGVYFCTLCPSISPKERSRQALDRLPLVSNFFNQFLEATLRWCTSFTKFRSRCRLACFKWTCLPVFTNMKPALFDCLQRQQFVASSERLIAVQPHYEFIPRR